MTDNRAPIYQPVAVRSASSSLYPSASDGQAVAVVPVAAPGQAVGVPRVPQPLADLVEQPGRSDPQANAMYGDSAVLKGRYGEAGAPAGSLKFEAPAGWGNGPADQGERVALGRAAEGMGIPASIAAEVWTYCTTDTGRAVMTKAQCMASLTREWGRQAPAKIAAVQAAVEALTANSPQARAHMVHTLGNDATFIRMCSAALSRARR